MKPAVGVYGSRGYLGSIVRSESGAISLERGELWDSASLSAVIDASFPTAYKRQRVWDTYRATIARRSAHALTTRTHYIYLGSMSSLALRSSCYGRRKREVEEIVAGYGATVLRLGLVVGDPPGGRYKQLLGTWNRMPIKVIPDPSSFPVYVTPQEGFLNALESLVRARESQPLAVVAPSTYLTSLGELLSTAIPAEDGLPAVWRLGPPSSKLAQLAAARIGAGQLDSLRSLALMGEYGWDQRGTAKIESSSGGDAKKTPN